MAEVLIDDRAAIGPQSIARAAWKARSWIALFCGALILRLAYLLELRAKSPFWDHPYLDARYYLQWAREILGGSFRGTEVFVRAPGYPYFLAAIGTLCKLNQLTICVAQAVLGALSCLILARIGARTWSRRTGLIAGWAGALHGALLYWGGEILLETLFLFLVLLSLLLLVEARQRGGSSWWFCAGLFAGLAAITRPTGLALLLVLPLSALVRMPASRPAGGSKARALALSLFPALLVVGAVTIRNGIVGGDFVPVASHGGINFWTGNNARADGKIVVVPEGVTLPPEWKGKDNLIGISVVQAEKDLGRPLKPSEVSAYWVRRSFEWMRGDPAGVIKLYLRKLYYFWAGSEYTNNEDVYSFRRFSSILSVLLLPVGPVYFPGALVMPLSLYGLFLFRREARRLAPLYAFVILYMATVLAFFVSSRHRLPVVPVCLLFAAAAGEALVRGARRRPDRAGMIKIGVFALLTLVLAVNPGARPAPTVRQFDRFEGEAWFERGLEAEQAGRADAAIGAFERATRLRPEDAVAQFHLGRLYGRQGRLPEAESRLRQALAGSPDDAVIATNLALTCAYQGKYAEARALLARVEEKGGAIDPKVRALVESGEKQGAAPRP